MANAGRRKPNINLLIRLRPVLRWVLKLRSSPKAIAGGLALGTFIAFTPTVGIQLIIAVLAATMLNMNRAAAILPVWITNPVTVAPIYTFNYWLGSFFWDGPPLSEVSNLFITVGRTLTRLEIWDIKDQFYSVLHMGKAILIPLLLGSVLIGLVLAVIVYFTSLYLLFLLFNHRSRKRLLNNKR